MSADAWTAVAVVLLNLLLLVFTPIGADLVLMGGLTLLLLLGVLPPAEALAGFANEGMLTVAALLVVAAGLQETGAVTLLSGRLFGRPRSLNGALLRMSLPVAALSAFLNNTPLVAVMIPAVSDWARRQQLPPSKLMMPLSFAAILGGTCTLIGTSTTLVVNGLLIDATGSGLGMFTLTPVGVPVALVGLAYLLLIGRRLLPERGAAVRRDEAFERYTVEALVESGGPLAGRSVEAAGLRGLPGLYLAEIERGERLISPVAPDETLLGGDRLVFVGALASVLDLHRTRGLLPAGEQVGKLSVKRSHRLLFEVVVSARCPLVGSSVREGRFRSRYDAVVIAIARGSERLPGKLGDVVLRAGDLLLLEAHPTFAERLRAQGDFTLVSPVTNSTPPRFERAPLALAILLAMVVLIAGGWLSALQGSLAAAGAMLATRCLNGAGARRSLDLSLLLVIAASFGLGRALETTGAAEAIAGVLLRLAADDPRLSLAVIYGVTMLFTELITNNGAAALVFPVALATAQSLGVDPTPFAIAIALAASASFATPIGYQTNLMVSGPGGYRFVDYLRVGGPLNLLLWALTSLLIPWLYPL